MNRGGAALRMTAIESVLINGSDQEDRNIRMNTAQLAPSFSQLYICFPVEIRMQRLSKYSAVFVFVWTLSLALAQPPKSPSPAGTTTTKPALERAIQVLFSAKSY